MEHSTGAVMMSFMIPNVPPPPVPLPLVSQGDDDAPLRIVEEMFESKSMQLQTLCMDQLQRGLSSLQENVQHALVEAEKQSCSALEVMQLEVTLVKEEVSKEIRNLKDEIFDYMKQEFGYMKDILHDLRSDFSPINHDEHHHDNASSKTLSKDLQASASARPGTLKPSALVQPGTSKLSASVKPSTSTPSSSILPAGSVSAEVESASLVSSEDEGGSGLSDLEIEVFGKSLSSKRKTFEKDGADAEVSDPDSEFAAPPPSKAGRKRGSKNKGKSKKELQEELEKLRKEKVLQSKTRGAGEQSLRKSTRH